MTIWVIGGLLVGLFVGGWIGLVYGVLHGDSSTVAGLPDRSTSWAADDETVYRAVYRGELYEVAATWAGGKVIGRLDSQGQSIVWPNRPTSSDDAAKYLVTIMVMWSDCPTVREEARQVVSLALPLD